ncbi:hypothetical protein VOI54_14230 [Tamlana sp. 2201CG12-4]|uniref:hypothetical protein n=1 Tax=Tamlana sp. 2201CG12-4 TaxID=3112582 RepID=UPI002DB7DB2C|nr:hypothetical protein [Tamlana sp. 2201CG12-4]MEC3908185.1 hypothetical protein [Tamlana sp. 2201CG12-4]
MEYEKVAKDFHQACVDHNVQAQWLAATMDNMSYLYVTPIENFADLDKRPFADMAKAMGDKFGEMFDRFDKCYDSHGTYVIILDEELTYMPDGFSQTQEGMDYRDYYFIHYVPKNGKKLREGMKAVKEMFAAKGSKSYYRIYRTGFGSMNNYYMVAMSSKDAIDSATKQKANEELLGPERYETFNKVLKYASKMEEVTGEIRRDLSYSPKKE